MAPSEFRSAAPGGKKLYSGHSSKSGHPAHVLGHSVVLTAGRSEKELANSHRQLVILMWHSTAVSNAMYRTACKLTRRSILTTAVAGATLSLHDPQDKLSIYPASNADIILVDSPSKLENQIGSVRRRAQGLYSGAHTQVQGWVSKWIGVEHAVESRIKSIIAPNEPLTPGVLYVGVATLSGSILARNRALPTRFLLPPLFLVLSAHHFLPKTTHNLFDYIGSLEDEFFPTLAQKHETAKAHSATAWARVKDTTEGIHAQVEKAMTMAVDRVQEVSGLKLRETLGRQRAVKAEIESLKSEAAKAVQEPSKPLEENTKES